MVVAPNVISEFCSGLLWIYSRLCESPAVTTHWELLIEIHQKLSIVKVK